MPDDESARQYVTSRINRAEQQVHSILNSSSQAGPRERFVFDKVIDMMDQYLQGRSDERLLILPGLRGTGKTTILAQAYQWLRSQGIDEERILHIEADEAWVRHGCSILDIVDAYEGRIGLDITFIPRNEPRFLLIDEAQKDPRWDLILKIIYDRTKSIFTIATGSSALLLAEGAEVVRRAWNMRVGPLALSEHIWLKKGINVDKATRDEAFNALFRSQDAKSAWARLMAIKTLEGELTRGIAPFEVEDYLVRGSIPRALGMARTDDVMRFLLDMEGRIVDNDLTSILAMDMQTKVKAYRLIHIMALNDRSSMDGLARDLEMSKATLIPMLAALERSGLLLRIRPYGSEATRNRKTSKYCFMASSMRAAHLWDVGRPMDDPRVLGPLLEDALASGLHMRGWTGPRMQIDFDHHDGGADFLVGNGIDPPIAVEVGYGKKEDDQVRGSAERVKVRYGITISDKQLSLSEDGAVIRVPIGMALMML